MKNGNGYATKIDLKKLEGKMDLKFEQVDKRFEQVDKRFEQVDKRFGQIDKKLGKIDMRLGIFHFEWEEWEKDALTEFNSQWITRIDPILAEIEKHREQEIIWAEENRQTQIEVKKNDARIGQIMNWIEGRKVLEPQWNEQNRQIQIAVRKLEGKVDGFDKKLDAIAKKVGV
ncbi:hypothetical protein HZB78_03865 [Candidatus Collierbacteria bacterium]|nr:hypothetical protein [Candidatus Collierbacteria bacterium]